MIVAALEKFISREWRCEAAVPPATACHQTYMLVSIPGLFDEKLTSVDTHPLTLY